MLTFKMKDHELVYVGSYIFECTCFNSFTSYKKYCVRIFKRLLETVTYQIIVQSQIFILGSKTMCYGSGAPFHFPKECN